MEGGSQAQDHGQAIYAKRRYSVSSTFATGCSVLDSQGEKNTNIDIARTCQLQKHKYSFPYKLKLSMKQSISFS